MEFIRNDKKKICYKKEIKKTKLIRSNKKNLIYFINKMKYL